MNEIDNQRRLSESLSGAGADVDIGRILSILNAGKLQLVVCSFIGLLFGAFAAFVASPVYRSEALLQVEDSSATVSGLADLSGIANGQPKVEAQIQIIKSRSVLRRAVEDLQLQIKTAPVRFPVVGEPISRRFSDWDGFSKPNPNKPIALKDASYAWGKVEIDVTRFSVPESRLGETFTIVKTGNDEFEVYDKSGERIVKGTVGSSSGDPLGEELSMFVRKLNVPLGSKVSIKKLPWNHVVSALQGSISIKEVGNGTGIIEMTMSGGDPSRIAEVLNTISRNYVRQNVERRSEQAKQSISFLNEQLPQLRGRLEGAENEVNKFRQDNRAIDLNAETSSLLEQSVKLQQQISQLELQKLELGARYTRDHPSVRTLEEKIGQIKSTLDELELEIKKLPQTQQRLLQLKRDVEVNTELYSQLLNSVQELRIVEAGTVGNVRIIDEALVASRPIAPNRVKYSVLGLLTGTVLSLLAIFAKQILRKGVIDPAEVETKLGIQIYGAVPFSSLLADATRKAVKREAPWPLLVDVSPHEPATEAIRSIRTALHFATTSGEGQLITISGPSPGVGKSFLSTNLAALLASSDLKVLLIDADMRRGHLNDYLAVPRTPGLAEVLSGQADAHECLIRFDRGDFDLLKSGSYPTNPSELLMSKAADGLLKDFRERYDVVIVDCPPVLAVTDATILAEKADIVLIVLKSGEHSIDEIRITANKLSVAKGREQTHGVVFNSMVARGGEHGYYGAGYYTYDYSSKT